MSENLMENVPSDSSKPEAAEFTKKIRHIDAQGLVHEFDSTEDLMQWRQEENESKHNS